MESTLPQQSRPQLERPGSLADFARRAIERAILAGEYRPGERLVEERLCEELGVSRPPLREALQQLSFSGIIEHRPRRGVWVKDMTQQDVYEIVSFRRELERMALRLAIPGLDPFKVAECEKALDAMRDIANSDDEGGLVAAGFAFHVSVIRLAGHGRIEQAYRSMALQLQLCMAMNNRARRRIEDLQGNVRRHEELLSTILTEDLTAIETALDQHGESTFVVDSLAELREGSAQATEWLSGYVRKI